MELTDIEEQKPKVCIYTNSKSNTESHITQRNRLRDYCNNKGYNYEFWEEYKKDKEKKKKKAMIKKTAIK